MLLREVKKIDEQLSVAAAREVLATEKKLASATHQGNAVHRHDRVKQAEAIVKAAEEADKRSKVEDNSDTRQVLNDLAKKKAAETPEDRKKRYNNNISLGQQHSKELNDGEGTLGGLDKIAAKVLAYVKAATSNGTKAITIADIAHNFDKPESSVSRWLNKPAFKEAKSLFHQAKHGW